MAASHALPIVFSLFVTVDRLAKVLELVQWAWLVLQSLVTERHIDSVLLDSIFIGPSHQLNVSNILYMRVTSNKVKEKRLRCAAAY